MVTCDGMLDERLDGTWDRAREGLVSDGSETAVGDEVCLSAGSSFTGFLLKQKK